MTDEKLCNLVRAFTDRFENTCMGQIGHPDHPGEHHPGNDFNQVRGLRVKDLYEFARSIEREAKESNGSTNH